MIIYFLQEKHKLELEDLRRAGHEALAIIVEEFKVNIFIKMLQWVDPIISDCYVTFLWIWCRKQKCSQDVLSLLSSLLSCLLQGFLDEANYLDLLLSDFCPSFEMETALDILVVGEGKECHSVDSCELFHSVPLSVASLSTSWKLLLSGSYTSLGEVICRFGLRCHQ